MWAPISTFISFYMGAHIFLFSTISAILLTIEVRKLKQTDAQLRATKKYQSKFEMLRVRVSPEEKQEIVDHAKAQKESISAFLRRAVFTTITEDLSKER